jgi:hypothetical protein
VVTVERQTPAEELPCTYYRRFADGLADIPKLLTQFTEVKWSAQSSLETAAAFQSLKKLCTATVLGYQLPGERFVVNTGTNVGIGGVLCKTARSI